MKHVDEAIDTANDTVAAEIIAEVERIFTSPAVVAADPVRAFAYLRSLCDALRILRPVVLGRFADGMMTGAGLTLLAVGLTWAFIAAVR